MLPDDLKPETASVLDVAVLLKAFPLEENHSALFASGWRLYESSARSHRPLKCWSRKFGWGMPSRNLKSDSSRPPSLGAAVSSRVNAGLRLHRPQDSQREEGSGTVDGRPIW